MRRGPERVRAHWVHPPDVSSARRPTSGELPEWQRSDSSEPLSGRNPTTWCERFH